MDNKNLTYRPNVCLIILNPKQKIFLGERLGDAGHWQLPQGGAEDEFSLEENALREANEELGANIEKFEIVAQLQAKNKYDWKVIPDYAKGIYCGQEQTFFILNFLGEDSEINLDRYQAEFQNWKWCSLNELEELADTQRLIGYQSALLEAKTYIEK